MSPGTYTVVVSMIGYEARTLTGVQVSAGQMTNLSVSLQLRAVALDPIQISVGKKAEKATEAPQTVAVVSEMKIDEKVVTTGFARISDGTKVAVSNADETPTPAATTEPPRRRGRGGGRKS